MRNFPRGGIYAVFLKADPHRCYVGSSFDIAKRFMEHRAMLRRGAHHAKHLQHAWNRYGEAAFDWVTLESVPDVSSLLAREQAWFDRFAPAYNICRVAGATRGVEKSDETRAKLSASNSGKLRTAETRERMGAWQVGRTLPPETRRKISEARRGRPLSEAHKAAIGDGLRGKPLSAEVRARMSEGCKGRKHSPETLAKMSATQRRLAAERRERQCHSS